MDRLHCLISWRGRATEQSDAPYFQGGQTEKRETCSANVASCASRYRTRHPPVLRLSRPQVGSIGNSATLDSDLYEILAIDSVHCPEREA
jgi:hypothetical protein